jgi:hypothetical protein
MQEYSLSSKNIFGNVEYFFILPQDAGTLKQRLWFMSLKKLNVEIRSRICIFTTVQHHLLHVGLFTFSKLTVRRVLKSYFKRKANIQIKKITLPSAT